MSTDALREALELKIDELLDEFVAELDRKTFEDYAQKRNTYSSRIAALAAPASGTEGLPIRPNIAQLEQIINDNPRAKDVWVKPDGTVTVRPSETDKLPVKWRERYVKHHRGDEECCCCSMCAIELEAARQADRVGAPTSTK